MARRALDWRTGRQTFQMLAARVKAGAATKFAAIDSICD